MDLYPIILDLRTLEEYNVSHQPRAIHIDIPSTSLTNTDISNLRGRLWHVVSRNNRTTPIRVYCLDGMKAKIVKNIILGWRFSNVTSIGEVENNNTSRARLI